MSEQLPEALQEFLRDAERVLREQTDPALSHAVLARAMDGATEEVKIVDPGYTVSFREALLDAIGWQRQPQMISHDGRERAASLERQIRTTEQVLPVPGTKSEHVIAYVMLSARDSVLSHLAGLLYQRYGLQAEGLAYASLVRSFDHYAPSTGAAPTFNANAQERTKLLSLLPQLDTTLEHERFILDMVHFHSKSKFTLEKTEQMDEEKQRAKLDRRWRALEKFLVTSEKGRETLLTGLRRILQAPDVALGMLCVRQGIRQFVHHAMEVTDHEWWRYIICTYGPTIVRLRDMAPKREPDAESTDPPSMRSQLNAVIAKFQPMLDEMLDQPMEQYSEEAFSLGFSEVREMLTRAHTFLSEHPTEPPARILREVVDCDRFREELSHLRQSHNPVALEAKEIELVSRIFSALMRYPHASTGKRESDPRRMQAVLEANMPILAAERKQLTCFSGPWMMASLLLEAGIPEKQLYFASVQEQEPDRCFGTHAALAFVTSDRRAFFIDPADRTLQKPFSLSALTDSASRSALVALFTQRRNTAVHLRIAKDKVSETGNFRDFFVLPLLEGAAAFYFQNIAITFLQEKRWPEALRACEIGLQFHPESPDLHYQSGLAYTYLHESDNARLCFERAVLHSPRHQHALMQLGDFCAISRDTQGAIAYYQRVLADERKVWGSAVEPRRMAKLFVRLYGGQSDGEEVDRDTGSGI